MVHSNSITYKYSLIHYLQFGRGEKYLIAFHGFGESGDSFLSLEPSLGEIYNVIAIDIPFHGKTNWSEKNWFNKKDLEAITELIIKRFNINRFSVLGFSMGGKCALLVADAFSKQIDEILLMASDCIRTNKVYNIAVYPTWGRHLFKTTIKYPAWFFAIVKIADKLKLITPWLNKFTFNHMRTKEKRERVYNTWMSAATMNPNIKSVKQKINSQNIKVYLFFGKRDEVIPVSVAEYFAEGLSNCHLTVLDRGHYFIDDKLNEFVSTALKT